MYDLPNLPRTNPKLKLSEEEFREIADKIYTEFKKL